MPRILKRIVDGVTYNTATSRLLATSTWEDHDNDEHEEELYQTRGGAFFLVNTVTKKVWVERDREWDERECIEVEPLDADRAQKWMMQGDVEVIDNPFGDPPEAEAETEPGSTVYVRVPPSLKRAIDQAAGKASLSVNAWAMQCLERCLSGN
jgi:hypothetical protein